MYRGIVIVLLLASVLAFANGYCEPKHNLTDTEKKCAETEHADCDFVANNVDHPKKLLYDSKTKCYMHCIMQKNKTVKDDLSFNKQKFLNKIEDYYREIISSLDYCAALNGYNACDDNFKRMMCIHNDPLLSKIDVLQHTGLSRPE